MPRRESDPYGAYRFALVLGSVQAAGFAECTGLSAETKVLEYVEGGRNESTLKFPETTNYGNVSLKRGVTSSNELLAWFTEVATGAFGTNPRSQDFAQSFFADRGSNLAIELRDETGRAVRRWSLVRAFPVKWQGPDLKGTASEVALETLELTHEGIVEVDVG
ncbi:MAG: phage tail protein [Acidobacteriota bacterium]